MGRSTAPCPKSHRSTYDPPIAEIDPGSPDADKTAFWIETYNAAVVAVFGEKRRTGTLLRHLGIFRDRRWPAAGHTWSLDEIEHGLLRGNKPRPLGMRPLLKAGDERLALAPTSPDPRIHFALNCGATSCPPIRAYDAASLHEQLDLATRAYLAEETTIDRDRGTLELPGLLKLYRSDFDDPVEFAAAHLDDADAAWVRANRDSAQIRFARFDWTVVQ